MILQKERKKREKKTKTKQMFKAKTTDQQNIELSIDLCTAIIRTSKQQNCLL